MRRRALLTSIAAGSVTLAGCSFVDGSNDEPTMAPPSDRTPTDGRGSPDDGGTATDSDGDVPDPPDELRGVIDLETVPRTYSLGPTHFRTSDEAAVSLWFDRTATAEHPARVRGVLENANDFANTFRIEWIPVVGNTHAKQPQGYDHEAALHMAPTENNDLATTVPNVRQNGDGFWHVADAGPWMAETHRLEAGESVELEYRLVGERGLPGRPTGTYEFRGDGETVNVHVWDSEAPGPDGDSRFAGRSVPGFGGDVTTAWYHEAGPETLAYVRPSAERLDLDGAIDFEVVNHSKESVSCGHWNLHKLVDGEWFHIGPGLHTADCRMLPPGGRIEWSLRAFNDESVSCGSCSAGGGGGRRGLTRGYLGGGEYAVVAGYGAPADESAALIELVGDPVDIVLTEDASVERDGRVAVVTTKHYDDGERPADDSLTVTRTTDADERLLPEQVMGAGGPGRAAGALRNALPAMDDDVERVVLRTDERDVDRAIGYDADSRRFRLRGQAYAVQRGEA